MAKRRLGELLGAGIVEVHVGDPASGRTKDRHGRTLATISVNGNDVGLTLVSEGLAREWTGRRAPWCE